MKKTHPAKRPELKLPQRKPSEPNLREPKLTPNAKVVLEKRYLLKDDAGRVIETPGELFARVAKAVASQEGRSNEGRSKSEWFERFYELMASLRFLPNSPTLMNAGKSKGQLSACFVLPIEDSLDSIFETLKSAAKIHQSGGGTGFSFSRIRAKGSLVHSSHGVASGPVSFLRIFDVATETIKQGGVRRGANMGILRVDHPDILEFIEAKRDQKSILNFNLSVGITDEFMECVRLKKEFVLRDTKGIAVSTVDAGQLFDRMVQCAWESGDPGLVFLDRINRFNPTPKVGQIESTNPCGEQTLLPYESCNLGSLNLGAYYRDSEFQWSQFKEDIHTAVRFLDNVIDLNDYPVEDCKKVTLRNRKIGLGVMGFADLLLMAGIPYASEEALELGEQVMSFLDREAKQASQMLAKERGAFPNWKGSLWHQLGYPPFRNATVSTVAPTGTISMIAGASSGIEPLFSGVFYRNVLSGERLVEIHPVVEAALKKRGKMGASGASVEGHSITDDDLSRELGPAWSPSKVVPVEKHVQMQAAFQRHSDSAVSKTINLPASATVQDVKEAYLLAYELGCKGITVYRDQSRSVQVLEHALPPEDAVTCPSC